MLTEQTDHGLNERALKILRRIFQLYAQEITAVGLFGSRATGTWRQGSDIDIVLYGDIDDEALGEIRMFLENSMLVHNCDVLVYDKIAYLPLKTHVDAVMKPLFTAKDLEIPRHAGTPQ